MCELLNPPRGDPFGRLLPERLLVRLERETAGLLVRVLAWLPAPVVDREAVLDQEVPGMPRVDRREHIWDNASDWRAWVPGNRGFQLPLHKHGARADDSK